MRRKPCKSCPLALGKLYGFEPRALWLFSQARWCERELRNPLNCVEGTQLCQGNLAVLETALECHRQGKPLPFKLHSRFHEQLQALVEQFKAGKEIEALALNSEFDRLQIEQAIRIEMNQKRV